MFNRLVELVKDNPKIHDQKLMNCVLLSECTIQQTYGDRNAFKFKHDGGR